MWKSNKILWIWVGIWVLGLILRVVYLDRIPTGISPDELHFVVHARSVALTGSDLSGNWRPWLLEPIPDEITSELPAVLMAVPVSLGPLSLLWSKLGYAIIGSGTVVVLGLFGSRLFGMRIGLITGLLMAINPWHIFVSRTAFDAPLAVFFWITGLWLCTYVSQKKVYLAGIFFGLAFFNYIGTKILLVPVVGWTLWYARQQFPKSFSWKAYTAVLICAVLLTVGYGVRVLFLNSERSGELLSLHSPHIHEIVDERRQMSLAVPVLPALLNNKLTVVGEQFITKYLGNFSVGMLFLTGDDDFRVSLWRHGYFYYIDVLFLIVGLIWLFRKKRYPWIFLTGLILLSALPDALRNDPEATYAFHSALLFPLLTLFIAGGVHLVTSADWLRINRLWVTGLVCLVYVGSLINFIGVYSLHYPIYGAEATDFSMRLLARAVKEETRSGRPVYVVHNEPQFVWRSLVFYENGLDLPTISDYRNQEWEHDRYTWRQVTIVKSAAEIPATHHGPIIMHRLADDLTQRYDSQTIYSIPQLDDGGSVFRWYRSEVCAETSVKRFPSALTLRLLQIESLPVEDFCREYIMVVS